MKVNLNTVERILAQHKVYDAWPYVQSLIETLDYMSVSYDMLVKVYDHRVSTIQNIQNEKMDEVLKSGRAQYDTKDIKKTNLNIGGYELNDIIFLRKTAIEFFHYGRICMDVLFQIANASLLGDKAFNVDDKGLLRKLFKKLRTKPEFENLLRLMDSNKNDTRYKYLMAFDNYMKHIKIILITVKNSIFIGNKNTFKINAFSYNGINYASEDALLKIREIHDYILSTIDTLLQEIVTQIPNCFSTRQRIQEIYCKQVLTERDKKSYVEYISFFIDVPNDISDLPNEIKVRPVRIKPNHEIYSFNFQLDKIFIRKTGSDEQNIVGVATLKNGEASNEFYRVYEVNSCQQDDYILYIKNFNTSYAGKITMNLFAMEGDIVCINDDIRK